MYDSSNSEFQVEKSTKPILRPEGREKLPTKYRVENIQELLALFNKNVPVVFCGGQHAIWKLDGSKEFANDRKAYKQWCEDHQVYYYDPQESDPIVKTFESMRNTDKMAALLCMVDLITLGKESIGLVSIIELIFDLWLDEFPHVENRRILQLPDATDAESFRFEPPGVNLNASGDIDLEAHPSAITRHTIESVRAANLLRSEVMTFARQIKLSAKETKLTDQVLAIAETEDEFEEMKKSPHFDSVYKISDKDLHVTDLVHAFAKVLSHERVLLYFEGEKNAAGVPEMKHIDGSPAEQQRILKQYLEQGNQVRKFVLEKLTQDPHTFVLYGEDKDGKGLAKLLEYYHELNGKVEEAELADRLDPNPPWQNKINAF